MFRKIRFVVAGLVALVVALVTYNAGRHLVFWSSTEDIFFGSGDTRLAGTLIKPDGAGLFPAVVILHGSGPETRRGPGYRVHANAFVRSGFAVLLYDKRGTGDSGGDFEAHRYRDFIADAASAVHYLASREDIDSGRIGLNGHSEGGWFAPEIAAATDGIAFIINKAGPPLSWIETVLWDVRNEYLADGAAEADLDALLALTRRRWDYLRGAAADPALAVGPEREAMEAAISEIRATVAHADRLIEDLPAYDADLYQKFASYSYDPTPYLREIMIPMLYVFGELDENVPTTQSVVFLESFREEYKKDITIHVLPRVGHSFQTWKGLFVFEFLYPPGYLEFIGSWAAQKVNGDQ